MTVKYEAEQYIHEQVPIKIYNHRLEREMIYTVQHWHNSIELNLVSTGCMVYTVNGRRKTLRDKEVILINSGALHSAVGGENVSVFEGVTVLISKPFIDSWLGPDILLQLPEDPDVQKSLICIIEELGRLERADNPHRKIMEMEQLFRLMGILAQCCVQSATHLRKGSDRSVDRVKQVVNYLNIHYKEDLSLNGVAEVFGCTPQYLSRSFKEHIGTSFYRYLQNVRLMNTMNQLQDRKDITLLECSLENGFLNSKSFIQTFKEHYHCTPSQWRRDNP